MIGTFMFLSGILQATRTAEEGGSPVEHMKILSIALALFGSVMFSAKLSGGHLNPAVSFMSHVKNPKEFPIADLIGYTGGQLLGAMVALVLYNAMKKAGGFSSKT